MITSSIQERQGESIRHLRRATAKIIKRKIPLPPSPIFSLASLMHSRRNELMNSPLEQKIGHPHSQALVARRLLQQSPYRRRKRPPLAQTVRSRRGELLSVKLCLCGVRLATLLIFLLLLGLHTS